MASVETMRRVWNRRRSRLIRFIEEVAYEGIDEKEDAEQNEGD